MKGQTLLSQPEIVVGALAGLDVSVVATAAVKDPRWLYTQGLERPSGVMERLLRKCRVQSLLLRECMAECLGVYIMIVSVDFSFGMHVFQFMLSIAFRFFEILCRVTKNDDIL